MVLEHEKLITSTNEKLHQKESLLDKQNEELKHLRSTTKSQENTISYFKKKIEEL